MKTNRDFTNLVCNKTIYIRRFFLTPIPALSAQFNSFSSFLAPQVDHETDTDVSFPIVINDAECKAELFVLDEASKESKLIA